MFNTEVEKATKAADKIRDAQAIDKYVGDIDTFFAGDWATYQTLVGIHDGSPELSHE